MQLDDDPLGEDRAGTCAALGGQETNSDRQPKEEDATGLREETVRIPQPAPAPPTLCSEGAFQLQPS
jgi:hypothetical protein